MREGSLAEIPYSWLLSALATYERTVVLEIRRSRVVKQIIVEFGVPVECHSNMLHETVERFLVSKGRISEEDALVHERRAAEKGISFTRSLTESGLVDAQELFKLLQQNLAKKLLDPFAFRDGEFKMTFDVPEVDFALNVNVPQLILTGVARFVPQAEVDAAVGPLVGKRLGLRPAPRFPLQDLKLSPPQFKVAEALRVRQRMDELVGATGIALDELTRLVYALAVIGLVAPEDQLPPSSRKLNPEAVASALQSVAGTPAPPPQSSGAPESSASSTSVAADATDTSPSAGAVPVTLSPAAVTASTIASASTVTPAGKRSDTRPIRIAKARPAAQPAQAPTAPPVSATTLIVPLPAPAPPAPPVSAVKPLPPAPPAPSASVPAASSSAQATPTAPQAPSAAADPSRFEYRRQDVTMTHAEYRRKDPFELLNVSLDASPLVVQQKFMEFAERFAPWDFSRHELAGVFDKASDLFFAGAKAFAQLSDVASREALIARRTAPPRREEAAAQVKAPAPTFAIKTDLLDPETQYHNARHEMEAGRYREAINLLEFVCDCDPQNGVYRAELAYCRYLEFPHLTSQPLRELKEALRMDPQCGLAAYYAGEVYLKTGQKEEAELYFRKAERLMPNDKRVEAGLRQAQAPRK